MIEYKIYSDSSNFTPTNAWHNFKIQSISNSNYSADWLDPALKLYNGFNLSDFDKIGFETEEDLVIWKLKFS